MHIESYNKALINSPECECGCREKIEIRSHHKYCGVPRFLHGHNHSTFSKEKRRLVVEGYRKALVNPPLCKCGCGDVINIQRFHVSNGVPTYIPGHYRKNKIFTPRETRVCPTCKTLFECLVTSNQVFCRRICIVVTKETRQILSERNIGKKQSLETVKNRSIGMKRYWSDKEKKEKHIKGIMKASQVSPNKQEIKLDEILSSLFPNQYKFVGDGEMIIGGKCPDFINVNGQKKVIELFGDFWHSKEVIGLPEEQHAKERIECFAQYGYQTLIIWEHELSDKRRLLLKLGNFNEI